MKKSKPTTTTKYITTKYNYIPSPGRILATRSMTIQNDTPSLGELVEKFIAGMPVRTQPGVYPGGDEDMSHEDEDHQEVIRMDRTEKQDVINGIKAMTERLRNLQREAEAEKEEPLKQGGNDVQPEA